MQNTSARRPTYRTGGLNGKPYLQCDKTTQQFFEDLALWGGEATLDTYSRAIFAVVEDVDATHGPALFGVSSGGTKGTFNFRSNADAQVHFVSSDADWRKGNVVSPMVISAFNNSMSSGRLNINGAKLASLSRRSRHPAQ